MKRPRKKFAANRKIYESDSDECFAYIAGYTEGGFPYGITWEEMREIEMADKNYEAGKPSNEPMVEGGAENW